MHATQPDTTERAAAAPAAQAAIKSSSRLLPREQRATPSNPLQPTRLKAGTKRTKDGRHVHTIPADIVRIPGLDLPGLSSWKVDKACRCKLTDLGHILGAMYDHQEVITNIDGWQWDGINKESYYKVHWKPTVIERWALHLCAKEGYTPTHIETISREEAKDVCTCELCWLPRGDCPTCHNCKRAYHPACLEKALLSGHKELGYWLCPICKFGSNDFKTTMRQSAHSDLIRVHWRPTLEPAPLITAHLDYTAKRNIYDEENRTMQEERHARPDANLPDHTRQGLPDPHTWLPRCTNLHSKATFHTYPINPQTDIVGTGKCETFLQLHPHMTTPAMSFNTGEPIMPKHDLVQHVTVHDESGRTVGLLTKQQHQHLHAWLQHTPQHTRNLATELVALLRRHDTQSNHHPMRAAQDKALATLHITRSFPSTVQRWADPLTVRPETTTYWSPDTNDTAFGACHNCLLVRHTGLSTWNVPADDAVALKCVNHAIHSATQEEAMATIMLIPGKRGISYPKHIDTLRRYPEYCQHLASIPPTKTTGSKPGRHANLHIYVIWNAAGQQLVTKGNPQGWLASTATALHPQRDTHPIHNRPTNQRQPATPPSGHKQHMRLPLDRDLPTSGHQRSHQQLLQHSTTQSRMAITEWATLAYSDGSCIKTSEAAPARVGAGVYIPETNVLITVALDDPESNTINKAELTAIHAALQAGATRIATDSLCSIYQIRRALANPMSLITHRHNDILTAIATLVIDSPVTLHFYKVRVHSGNIGNEGADALAKHAALHPELANTPAYRPTTRKETNTWLSNEADGESPAPLPDCRQSVRAHMHRKHGLGLANQDSIYYQMSQEITKAAAKGDGERVMADTNISTPAQRTALLYRTGGLYNQKLAMRWKRATDDRCPLCGEADSATHLLSGCSETLPMVQERHNGAGRLIAKAISKGTLGGYISFADTGSWEKGAKEDLDLPNDTLHTTLRALGLKTTATKNTTRPDILMVMPPTKTGTRGKAIKRVTIIEIKYCSDSRDNYQIWAIRLRGLLEMHNVWDVVENGPLIAPPALAADATPAQQNAHNAQLARVAADATANLKARNIILQFVSNQHVRDVSAAPTAKQAWDQLSAEFVQVSVARQSQLQTQLSQLRMQPEETVAQFFSRTMLLRDELASAGCATTEHSLMLAVLNAMPPDFKLSTQMLRYQLTLGAAQLDAVKKVLLQAEADLQQEQQQQPGPSLFSSSFTYTKGGRPTATAASNPADSEQTNVLFMVRQSPQFPKLSRTEPVATPVPDHIADAMQMTDEQHLDFYSKLPRWVIDSGANKHVMPWRSCLSDYRSFNPLIQLQLGGSGSSISVLGQGTTYLTNSRGDQWKVTGVLHAPQAAHCYLSVSELTRAGVSLRFQQDSCELLGPGDPPQWSMRISRAAPGVYLWYINAVPHSNVPSSSDDDDHLYDPDALYTPIPHAFRMQANELDP
ncbi:hypothetical protein QJQ45_026358 [Haematococcus lacustris]|nr:hypothetical protein QJQ45_026358 [Haematococcus lacustris]